MRLPLPLQPILYGSYIVNMSIETVHDAQDLSTPSAEIVTVDNTKCTKTEEAVNTVDKKEIKQEQTAVKQTVKKEKPVVITGKQLLQMKVT